MMATKAHSDQETMDELDRRRAIANGDEDLIPTAKRLTPAQLKGLRWFAAQSVPVSMFKIATDPSRVIRKRLLAAGLVEIAGTQSGPGGFGALRVTAYRISDAGRALLAEIDAA